MRTIGRMLSLRLLIAAVSAILLVVSAGPGSSMVAAQVITGGLSGTITDETGAVVADVDIVVINTDTGLQRQAKTDDTGYFTIQLLPSGHYTLTAEMPGFRAVSVNDIALQLGTNAIVDIILKPKTISETISVQGANSIGAGANHIDISSATVKYSISNKQVTMLPVWSTALGRNSLGVLPFLVPGVVPTAFGTADQLSNRLGSEMSINGSRSSSISFNLEGGDDNDDEYNRAASPVPNPDVLREFTIATNNYRADQGRSSGGIIDAIIKSGTVKFHGNARYFLINESLNAPGFFDTKSPVDRLNTFGGQLGGPLVIPRLFNGRAGTFFFFDYEGTRYRSQTSSTINVLTAAERAGDFSNLPPALMPRDPQTGRAFPDGIIPLFRQDPIARAYIQRYIPVANDGNRLFHQLLSSQASNDQFNSRIDHRLNDHDSVTGVALVSNVYATNGIATLPVGSTAVSSIENRNITMRETHLFSSRLINQASFTLNSFSFNRTTSLPGASGVSPSDLGFTGVHPQTSNYLSPPSVTLDSLIINQSIAMATDKTTWQIKDDLSWELLRHGLKFGAETKGYSESAFTGNNNGAFAFNGFHNLNTAADFLLGMPYSYVQSSGSRIFPNQRANYIYALDDWRVRPNLTLNLGVRYELAPPPTDKLDQITVFRPGEKSRRFPNAPVGLLFAGDPDPLLGTVPRSVYPVDYNNVAPRLGFAYSPKPSSKLLRSMFGDGKTALRAGWGVFFDQTYGRSFTWFSFAQPYSVSQSVYFFRTGGDPKATFANPFGSSASPWPLDLDKRFFIGTPSVHTLDPGFRTAYTYQYNITVQRELPWSLLAEAAYIGNDSFKLNARRELNVAVVDTSATLFNVESRRIYPNLRSVESQESTGRARYDSFQLRLSRSAVHGIVFDASYVFGKSLDDGSNPDVTSPRRWARSSFDRRHNFVASYTWTIPGWNVNAWYGSLLRGWQIGGITELRSGAPLNIIQSYDPTLTEQFVSVSTPDIIKPFRRLDPSKRQTIVVDGAPVTGNFFFDPNSFREVPVRDYRDARPGSLGRNVFDGPGIALWSISLMKHVQITESQSLSLRCDIRNLFDRPQFGTPQLELYNFVGLGSSAFGQVLSAGPGRNLQLSLKYNF